MNRHLVVVVLLVAVTLAVFGQVRHFPFINFDDEDYITLNPMVMGGLHGPGPHWALTANVSATWQPLTWLSFMADIRDGQANPGIFHTTNLVLHVLNVLLLYLLMVRLTRHVWTSALVAALFAVHPLHVESVAWVAERKDVLSTFWGLASLLLWVRHLETGRRREFVASVVCLALGLTAKPMLVTWPFVMLLLDYWPLERWNTRPFGRLVGEKWPFFGLALVSSVITYAVQAGEGAVARTDVIGLGQRVANAIDSYVAYLHQTVVPRGFAILYPHPDLPGGTPLSATRVGLDLVVLAAVTALVIAFRRRRVYLAGWLLFLGTLVPVIGLVQIGVHARADRFTYVPLIGIFLAVAWLLRELARALARKGSLQALAPALGVLMVAGCAVVAHGQAARWQDQIILYQTSLANTAPGAPRIQYNLALALSRAGRYRESLPHYEAVLKADPGHVKAWNNLGRTLDRLKQDAAAEKAFKEALRRQPDFPLARINYAVLLDRLGRRPEALEQRLKALAEEPDNAANQNAVGSLLAMGNRLEEALPHFRRAVALDPANRDYRENLRRAEQMLAGSRSR